MTATIDEQIASTLSAAHMRLDQASDAGAGEGKEARVAEGFYRTEARNLTAAAASLRVHRSIVEPSDEMLERLDNVYHAEVERQVVASDGRPGVCLVNGPVAMRAALSTITRAKGGEG